MACDGSKVFSLRVDAELMARTASHAARRGMTVQDYVVQVLLRDDFDERFSVAVQETERFYAG
ncbi:ribbon-helix-helix protein, CopG family [Streptomyces sp. SL13]|jgi:predicted HicB family RNase H-like nuclease|uniref:Ribbon-helix-helix protein, CopG family n=1 Tax=Streptantibioticus silvisoli TaxID=2705255 RepID=A0AA90H009_9ACTN|nr:ribbon-helix-helix protein, CopG family [Streptantibioticus silvisoli]MDI5965181.1 ribbon-helix-helix protein, CopG family [Streptantibioticus silvisoli]MDI5969606.1 ribbon-helix-helix protein, CopG family [Streptantibioticus silvisoli]